MRHPSRTVSSKVFPRPITPHRNGDPPILLLADTLYTIAPDTFCKAHAGGLTKAAVKALEIIDVKAFTAMGSRTRVCATAVSHDLSSVEHSSLTIGWLPARGRGIAVECTDLSTYVAPSHMWNNLQQHHHD